MIGDIQHHRLHRGQPGRQRPGVLLDQNANEPLQRAENGSVQHDRGLLAAVFGDVMGIQPSGHGKIHLNGAALPEPIQAIAQHVFDFGAVKRALAGLERPRLAGAIQRQFQRLFRLVPNFVAADPLFGPGRQRQLHLGETEIGVHLNSRSMNADTSG
jgi:hypothetical protein